jgi:hypothetical protein
LKIKLHNAESLKNCKASNTQKLKHTIEKLTFLIDLPEMRAARLPQVYLEECAQALHNLKSSINTFLNEHFDNLLLSIKRALPPKDCPANGVFTRISNLLSELEILIGKLDGESEIQALKQACVLDVKTLVSKATQETNKVLANIGIEITTLCFADFPVIDFQSSNIEEALTNLITVQKVNRPIESSIQESDSRTQELLPFSIT